MGKPAFDPRQSFEVVKPAFDPSQSYSEVPEQAPQQDGMLKQLAKVTTNQLPMLGGMAGGMAGATSGFLAGLGFGAIPGAVAGSAGGYALGQGAKDLVNGYIDPDNAPKTASDSAMNMVKALPEGALQEVGGQILGVPIQYGAKAIGKMAPEVSSYLAKKFGLTVAGVPEKYTEEYLARGGNIQARPSSEIMNELQGHFDSSQEGLANAKSGLDDAKDVVQDTRTNLNNELQDQKFSARSNVNQAADDLAQARGQAQDTKMDLNNDLQDRRFKLGNDLHEAKGNLDEAYQGAKEQLASSNVQHLKEPIQDSIQTLQQQVSEGSAAAFKILDKTKGTVEIEPVLEKLESLINDLKINGSAVSDTASASVKNLGLLGDRLDALGSTVTFPQAKQIIQQLDGDINFSPPLGSFQPEADAAKAQLRAQLDEILKRVSPEYKVQMQTVADKTQLLGQLSKSFGTDTSVINRLSQIGSEKGVQVDLPLLQRLGQHTGQDFTAPIQQHLAVQDTLNSPIQMQALKESLPEYQAHQDLSQQYSQLSDPQTRRGILDHPSMQTANEAMAQKQAQVDAARQQYSQMLDPNVRRGIDEAPEMLQANDQFGKRQTEFDAAKDRAQSLQSLNPNQIQNKIKSLTGANNYGAENTFEGIDQVTGQNYTGEIKDRAILDSFAKGDTNGSRKAVVGGAIGGFVAGPFGQAIGASAGMAADKFAGQSFKMALDTGIGISKFAGQLGPYTQVLSNAAARGPQALAATSFILQQTDQDYRKRVDAINGKGQ